MAAKAHLKALTSFRFFAALMIVVWHTHAIFPISPEIGQLPLDIGVSFFFVLSGFILSYVYVDMDFQQTAHFLKARIARVWPLHVFIFLLCISMFPGRLSNALRSAPYGLVPISNFFLFQSWIPFKAFFFSINSASWSISTELGFYLLFPLLISHFKNRWRWMLFSSLSLTTAVLSLLTAYDVPLSLEKMSLNLSTNPLLRQLEFVSGMCFFRLFQFLKSRQPSFPRMHATILELFFLSLLMLLVATLTTVLPLLSLPVQVESYLRLGGLAIPFVGFLITMLALNQGALSQVLSHPLLVRLGEISFAMYLLHPVLILYYRKHLQKIVWPHPEFVPIVFWMILLLGSYLLWLLVEKPARTFIMGLGKQKQEPKKLSGTSTRTPPQTA